MKDQQRSIKRWRTYFLFTRSTSAIKVLEHVRRVYSMSQNPPTFAETVKGKEKSTLRRPNCLYFKTTANLKRHEVIDLRKEMKFECEKLEGVGEITNKKIDITCKNRKYLLELCEQLKSNDSVYEVQLYELDNANEILGWVPTPLLNKTIQQSIEKVFGKVIRISEKEFKDG